MSDFGSPKCEYKYNGVYSFQILDVVNLRKKTIQNLRVDTFVYFDRNWRTYLEWYICKMYRINMTYYNRTIHIWYIYLHLVEFPGKCRYSKYTIHGCYGISFSVITWISGHFASSNLIGFPCRYGRQDFLERFIAQDFHRRAIVLMGEPDKSYRHLSCNEL